MQRHPIPFGMRLSRTEREGLAELAEKEGLSLSATLRRLLILELRNTKKNRPVFTDDEARLETPKR